jgi:hypothetical protein
VLQEPLIVGYAECASVGAFIAPLDTARRDNPILLDLSPVVDVAVSAMALKVH